MLDAEASATSTPPPTPGPAPGVLRVIGMIGAFQVGILGARLVRAKVLALSVGPTGVGLQSIVEQIMMLVALISTASLPFASVKFLSFAHSEAGGSFLRSYAAFRRVLLGLSVVGAGAGVTLALAWPGLFGGEVAGDRWVLVLALLAVPAFNLITLLTNALASAQRTRDSSALMLAQWVAVSALSTAGVLAWGLRGFFAGTGVALALVAIGGAVHLRRAEGAVERGRRISVRAELRRHPALLRFAAVQSVLIFTTPVAYLVARYTVLGDGGLAQAGLFAAAFTTAQSLTSVLNPANSLFLTPAMNRNDPPASKLAEALRFRDGLLVALSVLALVPLLFPEAVLAVLFTPEFSDAAAYLFLFVIAEGLLLLGSVHQALLIGLDDFASTVGIVLAGQASLLGLALWLVPALGVAGVGVALLIDYGLVLGLTAWRLWRRHEMAILRGLVGLPLAALAVLATIGAAAPVLPAGDPAVVGIKLAIGCAVSAAALRAAHRSGGLRRAITIDS